MKRIIHIEDTEDVTQMICDTITRISTQFNLRVFKVDYSKLFQPIQFNTDTVKKPLAFVVHSHELNQPPKPTTVIVSTLVADSIASSLVGRHRNELSAILTQIRNELFWMISNSNHGNLEGVVYPNFIKTQNITDIHIGGSLIDTGSEDYYTRSLEVVSKINQLLEKQPLSTSVIFSHVLARDVVTPIERLYLGKKYKPTKIVFLLSLPLIMTKYHGKSVDEIVDIVFDKLIRQVISGAYVHKDTLKVYQFVTIAHERITADEFIAHAVCASMEKGKKTFDFTNFRQDEFVEKMVLGEISLVPDVYEFPRRDSTGKYIKEEIL